MISFRTAITAIFGVLIVHGFAIKFDLYGRMDWFDIPMHFFGGYVIALLGLAVFGWMLLYLDIKPKRLASDQFQGQTLARFLLEVFLVIGVVMIIGVAWEWYEFISDQIHIVLAPSSLPTQMGIADTMDDLLNDFLGAITSWLLWRQKP